MTRKKKAACGRKPIPRRCNLCGVEMPSAELRDHEPGCRRKNLLRVGARYQAVVSNRLVDVEITSVNKDGSLKVTNLATGRQVILKSGRALRGWMDSAVYRFKQTPPADVEVAQ